MIIRLFLQGQSNMPAGGDLEKSDMKEETLLADDEKPFILVNQVSVH